MKPFKIAVVAFIAVAGLAATDALFAQQPHNFMAVGAKINPVMYPKDFVDVIRDCWREPVCSSAAATAATMLGIGPEYVALGKAGVDFQRAPGSEAMTIDFYLPAPYVFCRAEVVTNSVIPADGARASVYSVTSTENGVHVYAWTPREHFGQGRSLIDADMTLIGVLPEHRGNAIRKRECSPPNELFLQCAGATPGHIRLPENIPWCTTTSSLKPRVAGRY